MIVKIQIPITSTEAEPKALVYNRDRSFETLLPVEDVRYLFNPREVKIFCKARLEDQVLTIGRKLPPQDW